MLKRHSKNLLRAVLYVLLILAAYVFQATVFCEIPAWGAKPLLLPVAAAAAAMYGGRISGGVFGLIAGVMCDAALCRPAILFTLLLTVSGVIVGVLFETVLVRGFPSYFLCCAALLIISAFCQMFGLAFLHGQSIPALTATALCQTVYSLLFTVPTYWLARFIGRTSR